MRGDRCRRLWICPKPTHVESVVKRVNWIGRRKYQESRPVARRLLVCGESEERKLRSKGHDDGTEGALVSRGPDSPPAPIYSRPLEDGIITHTAATNT